MFQLLVLWLARRKLRNKEVLDEEEEAAAAFLENHIFTGKRQVCDKDCKVCQSDKTWFCGIMLKIPPWVVTASSSFSYDFNVVFDVIFTKHIVHAYFNQTSVFKGVLVLWSAISTCFGFLFWFYRWKSPAYFIHRTRQPTGENQYTHYSIDVGGVITCHPDKEDTMNGNYVSICELIAILILDEVSQIIISILSLTLMEPISDWPGFIEWLNIASSILGFFWYFYTVIDENRYWGVHIMSAPFKTKSRPAVLKTQIFNGMFDRDSGGECETESDITSEGDSDEFVA